MTYLWREFYQEALLETDPAKLPNRIDLALIVLAEALRGLDGSSGQNDERAAIADALRTMQFLQRELELATDDPDFASEQRRAN